MLISRRAVATLLIGGLLLAACGTAAVPPATTPVPEPSVIPADEVLQVVATNSILGEFVEQVAGEHIALRVLVERGGDAHTFDPTPADSAALATAQLVVENGLEFEPWLDDLYGASGSQAVGLGAADR
ncbi:MAG TPA: metal ABC transporter substrate-binding protein, partial [Roseiflexaceae bacterium]|nr:metal ABC transporter substrate-binding protein [Roseiflexaceae bacterium]